MSEVSLDQHIAVVEKVSELRGELKGVQGKQAEQREDITAINEKIESMRRDMAAGFESQRVNMENALTAAKTEVQNLIATASMNAAQLAIKHYQEAVPPTGVDILEGTKRTLAKPVVSYPLSTGIGIVLIMVLQHYGIIT